MQKDAVKIVTASENAFRVQQQVGRLSEADEIIMKDLEARFHPLPPSPTAIEFERKKRQEENARRQREEERRALEAEMEENMSFEDLINSFKEDPHLLADPLGRDADATASGLS